MSATDGLFAAKGKAQPVDQTRDAARATPATDPGAVPPPDPDAAPLTDLFGEPVAAEPADATGDGTGPDGNNTDSEPPPAASLLTIASQRSAARRRPAAPGAPETPAPGVIAEEPAETADTRPIESEPRADVDAGDAGTQTVNLPVPVVVQLPVTTGDPDTGSTAKSGWDRRLAALAAAVAICIAGGLTILSTGAEKETAIVARSDAPSRPDVPLPDEIPAPAVPSAPTAEAPLESVADASPTRRRGKASLRCQQPGSTPSGSTRKARPG